MSTCRDSRGKMWRMTQDSSPSTPRPTRKLWVTYTVLVLLFGAAAWFIYWRFMAEDRHWDYHWRETAALQTPRRALAAAGAGDFVYAIGGVDAQGQYVRAVEYSRIRPDGELEGWHYTTELTQGRIYHSAVTLNGYLYVLGGGQGDLGDSNTPVASVERAQIFPDGTLGPWRAERDMTTPRRGLQALVRGAYIYAIGGYNGAFLKTMEHVQVNNDGTLNRWVSERHQSTVDRYIHSAAIHQDKIYLLGGHMQSAQQMSYGDVEMSPVLRDGALGTWTVEKSTLRSPRFMAAALASNGYVYMLGGHNGGVRLSSVEFAPLHFDGHVGRWRFTSPLIYGRSAAATVVQGNTMYVIGGISDRGVLANVEMAQQADSGQLGWPRL